MRVFSYVTLLGLVLASSILLSDRSFVKAEDQVEEEDAEIDEEEDDGTVESEDEMGDNPVMGGEDEEDEEFQPIQASPDADTTVLFVDPTNAFEFPAGEWVKLLVGFTNKGDKDFIVDFMEASFRYPQDYSFHIQNFSIIEYQKTVEAGRQSTFVYTFYPSESFSARPFGLTVNLHYKDSEGILYQDAVFNQTVQVVEPDEGLDGETFFLYVFLAACAVLLLVAGQQFLVSFGKKKHGSRTQPEVGTTKASGVDFDWIPSEALNGMSKASPGRRMSPRQRKAKQRSSSGSDNE